MKIRSTEEVMEKAFEYASDIVACQVRINEIKAEMKSIKADYKEEGIAVGVVDKVINKIKAKAKQTDGDILEEEIFMEKFEASAVIADLITSLIE